MGRNMNLYKTGYIVAIIDNDKSFHIDHGHWKSLVMTLKQRS